MQLRRITDNAVEGRGYEKEVWLRRYGIIAMFMYYTIQAVIHGYEIRLSKYLMIKPYIIVPTENVSRHFHIGRRGLGCAILVGVRRRIKCKATVHKYLYDLQKEIFDSDYFYELIKKDPRGRKKII